MTRAVFSAKNRSCAESTCACSPTWPRTTSRSWPASEPTGRATRTTSTPTRRPARWPGRSAPTRSCSSPTCPGGCAGPGRPGQRGLAGLGRRPRGRAARGQRGERPKLAACLDAIEGGVSSAHIVDGRVPHSLLRAVHRRGPGDDDRRGLLVSLDELTALERRYAAPTYVRNPVQFVRGEGCALWDADGFY